MIRTERDGAVLLVRLDRPEKRNALTVPMLLGLAAAFEAGPAEGVRAACLLGEGRSFCSGFDLTIARDGDAGAVLSEMLGALSRAVHAMRAFSAPVVLGCQGAALAGGAALLGGADTVVADLRCLIGYPVVRLGISPAVSAPFLRGSVHDGPARTMLLDAGSIDASCAQRLGLIGEVVDAPEAVAPRAIALARALADKPGRAAGATKRWLLELETRAQRTRDDAAEGLAASVGLTESPEMQGRLAALWSRPA